MSEDTNNALTRMGEAAIEILREPRWPFSMALEDLKVGGKWAREGWNGKGMFIFLVKGSTFKVNRPPLLGIFPEGTTIQYNAHIDMKLVDGSIMVWAPSQLDLMSDDWYRVD